MESDCDVFCSFPMAETFPLAEALKKGLALQCINLFVCAALVGGSIDQQVAKNLLGCKMALILGSETYGREAAAYNSSSTYDEWAIIVRHQKPIFLVLLSDQFKYPKQCFNCSKEPSLYLFPMKIEPKNPGEFDAKLVEQIVLKFKSVCVQPTLSCFTKHLPIQ